MCSYKYIAVLSTRRKRLAAGNSGKYSYTHSLFNYAVQKIYRKFVLAKTCFISKKLILDG